MAHSACGINNTADCSQSAVSRPSIGLLLRLGYHAATATAVTFTLAVALAGPSPREFTPTT